jgi:hypothetical protein
LVTTKSAAVTQFVSDHAAAYAAIGLTISANGEKVRFTADTPAIRDFETPTIDNLTGDLYGSVATYQNYVAAQKRIDTITLTGINGTADILCDAYTRRAYFHTSLTVTATDFASAYAPGYLTGGVVLTSSGNAIIMTANVAGVDFSGNTTITNIPDEERGGLHIEGNGISEYNENNEKGAVVINRTGYAGGLSQYRQFAIYNGKGIRIARFYGLDGGDVISLNAVNIGMPNIPTSNAGLQPGAMYRDGAGADAPLKIK